MPFVQMIRNKMEVVGVDALNLSLDFNEVNVLSDNKEYLRSTLDVCTKLNQYKSV
jgi:leucyl-tRNA synthetase